MKLIVDTEELVVLHYNGTGKTAAPQKLPVELRLPFTYDFASLSLPSIQEVLRFTSTPQLALGHPAMLGDVLRQISATLPLVYMLRNMRWIGFCLP